MPLGANKAAIMGVAGTAVTGDVVLLSSQAETGVSEIDFTGLMTSTYGEYIFKFYNINPATDNVMFQFQVNPTDGADYNDSAITSTFFYSENREDGGGSPTVTYGAAHDQAQGTAFQRLMWEIGNGADEGSTGELHIFNPSSTTYVTQFMGKNNEYYSDSASVHNFMAGYMNDTTAIDDIRFKMSSGNFDGKIKMWGVK